MRGYYVDRITDGMNHQTDDLRIKRIQEVLSPAQVRGEFPMTDDVAATVYNARTAIHNILHGNDDRLLVIIGPCSIHDPDAAREYAMRLKDVSDALSDDLVIVMRVYFEKPRTTVGWKGLINDPDLDGSFSINKGLRIARQLMLDINSMGIATGTEYLDLVTPQYIADAVAWGAIGARTTESQVHRELASGLSCPVGFKNGTDGSLKIAIDAIRSATHPHHFLSLTKEGRSAIFSTTGNEDCHIILRGGKTPNYDAQSVAHACTELEAAAIKPQVMIDFSHANSRKQPARQVQVGEEVARQISTGETRIIGAMIESHLVAGRQDVVRGKQLLYGQSITDGCLGWPESEQLLSHLAGAVELRRRSRDDAAVS